MIADFSQEKSLQKILQNSVTGNDLLCRHWLAAQASCC
jgi:hypothetical protein